MLKEDKKTCDCNNINDNNEKENTTRECNNRERQEIMCKIQELDFSVEDLALYLDTHPEDQRALCLHREYAKQLKNVKDMYQKVYGPLTIDYPCNKWRWLEEPWPWERGSY